MNRLFKAYEPFKGEIPGRRNGVLISNDKGEAVAYAMWNLEDRGPMMIEPGWKVYQGMIIGEHNRENDLEVNVLKGKKLTNIRTTSKDEAVRLTPPIRMTLEKSLAWIQDDELVEVTPKSIRLRKTVLDPNDRKRAEPAAGVGLAVLALRAFARLAAGLLVRVLYRVGGGVLRAVLRLVAVTHRRLSSPHGNGHRPPSRQPRATRGLLVGMAAGRTANGGRRGAGRAAAHVLLPIRFILAAAAHAGDGGLLRRLMAAARWG
ncbi:hypothetical protein Lal_00041382 [Lupinus albus]|nr:hypothetical protein Lal_00041382 [Lupinus albus]